MTKMKESKKYLAGYVLEKYYDDVFLVLGYAIILFLVINYLRAGYKLESMGRPAFSFQKTFCADGYLSVSHLDGLCSIVAGKEMNCVVSGRNLRIADSPQEEAAFVYLEAQAYARKHGFDAEAWNAAENSVLLGKDFEPFTYKEKGMVRIRLDDREYNVFRFLESKEVSDVRLFLNWNNMDEDHKSGLIRFWNHRYGKEAGYYVTLQKNTLFGGELLKVRQLIGEEAEVRIQTNDYVMKQADWMKKTTLVLEIFAVASLLSISALWVERRKREYMICRAFGYGMPRIAAGIYRESGMLVFFSFVLTWILEGIYLQFVSGDGLGMKQEIFIFICSFLAETGIHILAMLYPLIKVWRTDPTQGSIDSI